MSQATDVVNTTSGSRIQLSKDQLAILADTRERINFGPGAFTVTTNALFQADEVEVYDSDCDDVPNAQPSFMASISSYGSDALAKLEQNLYDGNVIKNTSAIMIPDSEETLMLAEESRSKMLLKQQDPMMVEKKLNTTPIDYAALNQISQDFEKRFIPQTELSTEQAFWSQNSMNSSDRSPSSRPTNVEVPKELPKVNMVNTYVKKLKQHLAGFDVVVKERTMTTSITKGSWGLNIQKLVLWMK
nr:hypothetical protein [Tanacetum cinerariifolium]